MSEQAMEREHRITPLELFFDLVFVFAFTQVTTVIVRQPTWTGIGHGMLILLALWWAWSSYAWLTNTIDAGQDPVLAAVVVATGAMFVAALAVPGAFGEHGVLFGSAFLLVAVMHVALYALSARGEPELLFAILRIVPSSLIGASLIFVAGFLHGSSKTALWVAALAVGFIAPFFVDVGGWRVDAAHFVERHGLIVLIAIGEELAAIGIGARSTDLDARVVTGALLGFVVATSFWLAYFDYFPPRARQLLEERRGEDRIALARDVYTYLHFPMVAGVVLFAFAMEVTLVHAEHELSSVAAFGLCVGPAVFLAAFVALRFRISRTIGRGRVIAMVACVAVYPIALTVSALVALALIAAIWVALHAYEIVWWRVARAESRALQA